MSRDIDGLSTWFECGVAPNEAPAAQVVYVLRLKGGTTIPRMVGTSDIAYIGRSKELKRRLREHLRKSALLGRIRKEIGPIEVAWCDCGSTKTAKRLESNLLTQYEKDHIELPPMNLSRSGIVYQEVKKTILKHRNKEEMLKVLESDED